MVMLNMEDLRDLYRCNLLEDVIPFWEKNSIDSEYGGYFTSLDGRGEVFDTDKFVWLQARQVWIFSRLIPSSSQPVPSPKIALSMKLNHWFRRSIRLETPKSPGTPLTPFEKDFSWA